MKLAVVLNGVSSKKNYFYQSILPALRSQHEVDVFETKWKDHAVMLSAEACEKNFYDIVFAAGGDGTLHQVVNGMLAHDTSHSKLGIIPLGSGNDFARSIGANFDQQQIMRALQSPVYRQIDIGQIHCRDFSGKSIRKFFINVADIGMGPEVVQRVSRLSSFFPAGVAYYVAIIKTFFRYQKMTVQAESSEWSWRGKLRSLAIANGKYYGHGLCIAPDATIDDQLLNVFICGDVSVLDFVRQSETLKSGRRVILEEVQYKTAQAVQLSSDQLCLIEGDGEVLGTLPATVSLCAQKLWLLSI